MTKRSRQNDAFSPALKALSVSRIYRDYERAFTRATGLSLDLCAPETLVRQEMLRLGPKRKFLRAQGVLPVISGTPYSVHASA